jgi:hypothetical protein
MQELTSTALSSLDQPEIAAAGRVARRPTLAREQEPLAVRRDVVERPEPLVVA